MVTQTTEVMRGCCESLVVSNRDAQYSECLSGVTNLFWVDKLVGKGHSAKPGAEIGEWMMNFVFTFCKLGELVPDSCDGSLAAAKTFWSLTEHCRFFECNKSSVCFQDATPFLVEVYAKQILSSTPDIAESEKRFEASKDFGERDGSPYVKWKGW